MDAVTWQNNSNDQTWTEDGRVDGSPQGTLSDITGASSMEPYLDSSGLGSMDRLETATSAIASFDDSSLSQLFRRTTAYDHCISASMPTHDATQSLWSVSPSMLNNEDMPSAMLSSSVPTSPGLGTFPPFLVGPELGTPVYCQQRSDFSDYQDVTVPIFDCFNSNETIQAGHLVEGCVSEPTVDFSQAVSHANGDDAAACATRTWTRGRSPERRLRNSQWSLRKQAYTKQRNLSNNLQCPVCEMIFKRRDNIKAHVRRKHLDQYDRLYAKSNPPSKQLSPAPIVAYNTSHGEAETTPELAHDELTPSTSCSPPMLEDQILGPLDCDATSPESGPGHQKRSLGMAFHEDSAASWGLEKRSVPRLDVGENHRKRPLACPFQRYDPRQHQKCLTFSLQRIKDVKQHIYRCHAKPEYYCASCFQVFDTADERDQHSRQRDCKKLDGPSLPQFEGITDIQKKQLNEKSSRTLDVEAQWFHIWSIIFPDRQPPRSVFLGNYLEEMVPLLRETWDRQCPEIMANAGEVDQNQLRKAMDKVFDRLEAEMAGRKYAVPLPQIKLPNTVRYLHCPFPSRLGVESNSPSHRL